MLTLVERLAMVKLLLLCCGFGVVCRVARSGQEMFREDFGALFLILRAQRLSESSIHCDYLRQEPFSSTHVFVGCWLLLSLLLLLLLVFLSVYFRTARAVS
jgi:uncharacterized membrane protein